MPPVLLVPHGAEERAVRRAAPNAIIVAMHAGARAAALPDDIPAGLIVVIGLCGALRNVRTGDVAIFRDIVDETGAIRSTSNSSKKCTRGCPAPSSYTVARSTTS